MQLRGLLNNIRTIGSKYSMYIGRNLPFTALQLLREEKQPFTQSFKRQRDNTQRNQSFAMLKRQRAKTHVQA